MIYGYARVSTTGQTLEGQVEALNAAGVERLFQEKASGAKADRPQLERLLKAVQGGDAVIVTRLDRLARSTRDLLNILTTVSEKGGTFRSLADPWADTTSAHGRLMVTILGGLAEFERELILARTKEGVSRAKAKGKKMGRPKALTHQQRLEAIEALRSGEKTVRELGDRYNVSPSTISRLQP
jgi:DNA invertase Pin-like site-specific DNA recombinase